VAAGTNIVGRRAANHAADAITTSHIQQSWLTHAATIRVRRGQQFGNGIFFLAATRAAAGRVRSTVSVHTATTSHGASPKLSLSTRQVAGALSGLFTWSLSEYAA